MKSKKSKVLFSIVTIPAVIAGLPDGEVKAASDEQTSAISFNWVNPHFNFDQDVVVKKVAAVNAVAAATPIEATTYEQLKQAIYTNLRQYNTEFSIKYKGNTSNLQADISEIYEDIYKDETMIYESGTISHMSVQGSYVNSELQLNFKQNYHTTAQQEQFVTERVKEIAEEIVTSSMTDFEKVKAINDYIVLNTTYSTSTVTSPHAAYTILSEGKGVCQAYALLAYRLLEEAGINANFVTGKAGGGAHAWNLVEVDNKWYHLDTTWNDPIFSASAGDMSDYVQYKYFLLSDEDIKKDHIIDNMGYPAATDNTYRPLHNVTTPVQIGHMLYFPNSADNTRLYKMDLNNVAAGAVKISDTRVKHLVVVKDWVYFSNYSNGGYLSKMRLDGSEQSIVKKVSITSLALDGNDLVYKVGTDVEERLQVIDPEEENKLAAKAVQDLIAAIDDGSIKFLEQVANARVAYEALTAGQKVYVTNIEQLQTAELKVEQENAVVNAVVQKIAQLNELEEQFHTHVAEARAAYENLSTEQLKNRITNVAALEAAEALVTENIAKASALGTAIAALNTNDASYITATENARNAYNLLTAPQRALISNTTVVQLELAEAQKAIDEAAIFDVNYQLELLTDTAASFKTLVPALRAKYDGLTAVQKALIPKFSVLQAAEATYVTYSEQATALEAAIAALDEASSSFYVDVQKANNDYNALNVAQQAFISPSAVERLQTMVTLASENLQAAQAVIDEITALDVANTNYLEQVVAARMAYDGLTAIQQTLVTNSEKLVAEELVVAAIRDVESKIAAIPKTADNLIDAYTVAQTAYAALSSEAKVHVANVEELEQAKDVIAKANAVTQQIAGLANNAPQADVAAAREAYNELTAVAKDLVTNVATLEAAELRLEQEANQILADAVSVQIAALQPVDASFIAKYEVARSAYDALTVAQQAYVTNVEDLEAAAVDVGEVQAVIDAIASVSAVATYTADASVAQTSYDNLDIALRVAVTNASTLVTITANIAAAEQVEQTIATLSAASTLEEISKARADYNALTELQKQLVTNYANIQTIENEVKAANVDALIAGLLEAAPSFIADVTKAREAYNMLTTEQQSLVQNVAQLEGAEQVVTQMIQSEQEIAAVIQLIAKINDTEANFVTALEEAKRGYAQLTEEQQVLVTNVAELAQHEQTIIAYTKIAASFTELVTSLDTASVTFIAEVDALRQDYAVLHAAQRTFIPSETVALLEQYVVDVATIREVEAQLLSLNALSSTYYTEVAAAEAAYESLAQDYAVLLSLESRAKLEEAIAQVAADKEAAVAVEAAIAALTVNSTEDAIQTVRAQYNALTANQKQLVPNVAKLEEIEAAFVGKEDELVPDEGLNNSTDTNSGGTGSLGSSNSGSSSSDDDDDDDDRVSSGGSSSSLSGGSSSSSNSSSSNSSSSTNGTSTGGNTAEQNMTNPQAPTEPVVQVGNGGTSYSVVIPSTTGGQPQPTTITVSENVRITVPEAAMPTGEAAVAIDVTMSEENVIQFAATIDEAPVKFATYIEFEVANLPDGAVILRRDENGNLSAVPFTIEDGKHVIKTRTPGEFVVSTANVTFSDVANDGHKTYIDELAKRHIVTGVDAENFDPNAGMTRAQFSAMIARAMNLEAEQETQFADVKGKWYEASVQALAEAGIVTGKSLETFDPAQVINRQQTSVMIERLLKYAGVQLPAVNLETVPFKDFDKIPASYQPSVALMYQLGIFTGKDDGTFDASGQLTRSQMTKVLYKALQLAEML